MLSEPTRVPRATVGSGGGASDSRAIWKTPASTEVRMATERLHMRKIREVLRAKWELRLSNRQAAKSAGVSPASVVKVVQRARDAGLASYAEVLALGEPELEALLYPDSGATGAPVPRAEPDCAWIHRERARPGVTLELLHHEYLEQHPGGYQSQRFVTGTGRS